MLTIYLGNKSISLESGLYYMGGRYYSPVMKSFISALSLDTVMLNADTIYGLNLYNLANTNSVNMACNLYNIETSIPLVWDPPELSSWDYFWNYKWSNFWGSPFGKLASMALFAIATQLAIMFSPWLLKHYLITMGTSAAIFTASAIISGLQSLNQGNKFFDGFVNYINENWAQSLAITSAIFIITVAAGALVNAAKPKCFIAGTLVLSEMGYKKIEDIKVGDKVWAYDEETGEKHLKEVVRLFRNGKEFVTNVTKDIGEGVKEWIKVGISSLKNNDLITCTAGHPFYVLNASSDRDTIIFEGSYEKNQQLSGSWIASKDLRIGDELLLSNGENAIISSVEVEYYDEPQTTYNFEVEDFHTYYVGESGILVHNVCEVPLGGELSEKGIANSTSLRYTNKGNIY